jgi:uncharacterized metal-binding protein
MSDRNGNSSDGSKRLIFACSGAADVGAIADKSARTMAEQGVGKMFCLAGIGGQVEKIMETTKSADRILVIDGCPMNCTKRCLEQAGFDNITHLQLADMGLEKGKSPVSSENIWRVVMKATEIMNYDAAVAMTG